MKFKIGDKVRIKDSDDKTIWEIMSIREDRKGNKYITYMEDIANCENYVSALYLENDLEIVSEADEAIAKVQKAKEKYRKERNEQDTRLEQACMALTNLEIELESTDIKLKDYRFIMEYVKGIKSDIRDLWQDWIEAKY